ncbi:MAG: hypothetical protein ACK557_09355 [Planctomycetota bacterium]
MKQAVEQPFDGTATKQLETELRGQELSPRELEILEKDVSNAEYHHLGSARILDGIGRGFAEAMRNLVE